MSIAPGAIVLARSQRQVVVDVVEHGECRSVRLAPLDPRGRGLTLLHPFDRFDVLPVMNTPKRAGRRRVAYACAAALRSSYEAGQIRTLADAAISVLPYQLEPALAVLRGEATRVLLADEVGLGKTIQAGLILSELRARHALRRALILTPASLREQWGAELRDRFGLEVTLLDAGALGELQRTLPPTVNPWTLPGIALASIDLLKRDELLPQLEHVIWDAVVVDEAHHATRGTDRQMAAALACSRARVVILITATPHNGERAAFEELRGLGDLPDGQPIRVFRRTREDADAGQPDRRIRLFGIRRTAAERRLDARLRAYTTRVWRECGGGTDARLAMVVLRKRALSGAGSLARSLARRLEALGDVNQAREGEAQLSLDFSDSVGGELVEDDREPARELAFPGLADRTTERGLLQALLDAARTAVGEDSKAARLIRAIVAAREPVIVFTEYRDTLDDLRRRLDGRVVYALLHGAMMPGDRRRAMSAFGTGRARVLLATDAAAEGLNLQRTCRWVIHYEVPWSPVRIEQRNGRVDRLGQTRRVHVWHFVARGTEEQDVLARLARRSSIAARDLGDPDRVARAVFEGEAWQVPVLARRRGSPSRQGSAEASRVSLLRRLPAGIETAVRPLSCPPSRGSAGLLGVFRGTVLDASGCQLAAPCVGVRGPSLQGCCRKAARLIGHSASRSIAVHRAVTRQRLGRGRAVEALLADAPGRAVQPSLFDRRAVADGEHRRGELERAMRELRQQPGSTGPYMVRVSLVGLFDAQP